MNSVFIGGSRRVSNLNPEVRKRLDRIIANRLPVLIGDANGADKAVQHYLKSRHYDQVEVFCVEGSCRNNAGNWPLRKVSLTGIMEPPMIGVLEPAGRGQKRVSTTWPI